MDYKARAQKTRATRIERAGSYEKYVEELRKIGRKGGLKENLKKGMGSATPEQRREWGRRGGLATKKKLADFRLDYERLESDNE